MMADLSLLALYSFYLRRSEPKGAVLPEHEELEDLGPPNLSPELAEADVPDIFDKVARLEWDTLLYFYGAMMGIGGLGFIGYLDAVSQWLYEGHDAAFANILIGLSSAFVDNGTLMFAILSMRPDMPEGQWLLLTLTLGVGGSLLAIGSAPGNGLLGHYQWTLLVRVPPEMVPGHSAGIFRGHRDALPGQFPILLRARVPEFNGGCGGRRCPGPTAPVAAAVGRGEAGTRGQGRSLDCLVLLVLPLSPAGTGAYRGQNSRTKPQPASRWRRRNSGCGSARAVPGSRGCRIRPPARSDT